MRAPSLTSRPVTLRPGILPALAAAHPDRYPVLLDSAAQGALSRSSILAAFPRASLWREADGRLGADPPSLLTAAGQGGFLSQLEAWLAREPVGPDDGGELPFRGGWMVYLAYEVAEEIEPRLKMPHGTGITAFALRVPLAVIQQSDGSACVVAEPDVLASSVGRDEDPLGERVAGAEADDEVMRRRLGLRDDRAGES